MSETAIQTYVFNQHKAMINNPAYSDLILLVGPDKKKIHANKHILAPFSEYYRAAFNENWKQNKTEDGRQVLDHSDIDEATMLLILEYIYVGSTSEICSDKVAKVYLAADFFTSTICWMFAKRSWIKGMRLICSKFVLRLNAFHLLRFV